MAVVPVHTAETADRRKKFFEFLFDRTSGGYVCFARRVTEGRFEEHFFRWPEEEDNAMEWVLHSVSSQNNWFCPMLFQRPNRSKFDVVTCPTVWADLDTCPPEKLLIQPTLLLETSPRRYQGIWVLSELAEPIDAEEVSKRIAYYHHEDGADKSGWDLTQLLRVPFTLNHKYDPPAGVNLVAAANVVSLEELRAAYPEVREDADDLFPFPDKLPDGEKLLQGYRELLDDKVWRLLAVPPEKDWSKALWQLEMRLAESGLSREEMFAIAKTAACNKYIRDNRNEIQLWREVCKAWTKHRERSVVIQDVSLYKTPDLLSDGDLKAVEDDRTFIDDYVNWAKTVGDAAEAYHHAGAFVCLSALVSGCVNLPTSFGNLVPNLWFLLLADTTLTRKSTALDLAVDLLVQADPDAIMATDGSIEGIFTTLSLRPGQPSVFLRDEFSGLLEMMYRRDYYAGMGETLTKLYDGKLQKRVLRRETIEVKDPVLIIFAGGIRTKILQLLNTEQITSGFLPRFIFVTARSDISRLQPLGPPVERITAERDQILNKLKQYAQRYKRMSGVKVGDTQLQTRNIKRAELTPDAWRLYNDMEKKLLETGVQDTAQELLTPVMDRLAKSGLKAAILIAASRMPDRVVVDERDIYKAFSFVTLWRQYAMEVVGSIGLPQQERQISTVYDAIVRQPGILKSTLMNKYHLNTRDCMIILDTLEQRGKIERVRRGKSEALTPVDEEIE